MGTARVRLAAAIVVLGRASAIVRKLADLGSEHAASGHNPIEFCNVLFAGNLVALLALWVSQHRQLSRVAWGAITRREWTAMLVVAILAVAIAPSLIFIALEQTSVVSVVLIGRVEPPIVLALAAWFLRERVPVAAALGAFIALVGVAVALLLQPMMDGFMVGRPELLALTGAVALAVATVVSKKYLRAVPLGIFTTFRTAVGTCVFAIIVLLLFGPGHFADLLSPRLWAWMLAYGGVVVAGGQLLWFSALRETSSADAVLASSFSPVVGVTAAYLILGETPMQAQLVGGAIILAGIAVGLTARGAADRPAAAPEPVSNFDRGTGFKGI